MGGDDKEVGIMGCYDSVRVTCPKCGTMRKIQSKAGDCCCYEYNVFDAPHRVLTDIENDVQKCDSCGTLFHVAVTLMERTEFYMSTDDHD